MCFQCLILLAKRSFVIRCSRYMLLSTFPDILSFWLPSKLLFIIDQGFQLGLFKFFLRKACVKLYNTQTKSSDLSVTDIHSSKLHSMPAYSKFKICFWGLFQVFVFEQWNFVLILYTSYPYHWYFYIKRQNLQIYIWSVVKNVFYKSLCV